MIITHNGINNKNLDVAKDGTVIEPLTERINFVGGGIGVDLTSPGIIDVSLTPKILNNNISRSFNTNFVISNDRDVLCNYSFRVNPTATLAGGTFGRVDVQIRQTTNDTFTTVASAEAGLFGGLILGVSLNSTSNMPTTFFVPAGWQVRLQTSGSRTVTLIANQELQL